MDFKQSYQAFIYLAFIHKLVLSRHGAYYFESYQQHQNDAYWTIQKRAFFN